MTLNSASPPEGSTVTSVEESQSRFFEQREFMSYAPTSIVAVDGPAASGKGTLAKRLADHLGFNWLDTGLLYRAVAQRVRSTINPTSAAIQAARNFDPVWLQDLDLRSEEMAAAAAKVATIPEVRSALLAFQRDFAGKPPGAVLDGRDIGTVVCPAARVKLFVTAEVEVRAARRLKELQARGKASIYAAVLQDLIERDARDSERATAPMKAAADALILDTSRMDPDEVFQAALGLIEARLA